MNPLLQCKPTILPLFIAGVLACFGLLPKALAVVPPPDGGYPNFNTAEGQNALFSLTNGSANTAVGWYSLFSNTEGSFNTAVGAGSLLFNTADANTAFGTAALLSNTTGNNNTAVGTAALSNNTDAEENTATGAFALNSNTTGDNNTAVGSQALASNTQSSNNTAVGRNALASNLGAGNSAFGVNALQFKQLGSLNTAMGLSALGSLTGLTNINSGNNTALGAFALFDLTAGDNNTAVGLEAGQNITTGNSNTIMGFQAGTNLTTGNGNIYIANPGAASESNAIRIGDPTVQGATYIAGISGQNATGGDAVFVTSNGKLGTVTAPSSARFKDEIKPMNKASEVLLGLKPVTFRYKKNIDPNGIQQFGLVAEEVEKVDPDLVKRDRDGELQTVRYEAINAMLLNEFLKARCQIDVLQKQIEALTAGLQKVSAQLEVNKPAPQMVVNDQ
jgi:hypothetical protein